MPEKMTKEEEDALFNKYLDESTNIQKARNVGQVIGWYFVAQTPEWEKLQKENERLNKDNIVPTKEEKSSYYALEGKAFRDAHATIRQMGITGIKYTAIGDTTAEVILTLARPGMIIGERGKTINALTKEISDYFKRTVTIKLIEDRVVDSLYVYPPYEEEY